MTSLSVNLNKIAVLRNSRGRDYPNVLQYAEKMIELGVAGITVHPRQDERHIKKVDTIELGAMLAQIPEVEFNVEGYPSEDFLRLVEQVRPEQCTLVPDGTDQLTSDHGWQVDHSKDILGPALERIHAAEIRAALFLDPEPVQIRQAAASGYDRIELYTELFASTFGSECQDKVLAQYKTAKDAAISGGLGVNAGHDLDLENLATFLAIGDILEVSIGHALIVESIEQGYVNVVKQYLDICRIA